MVDDCWFEPQRDSQGNLRANPTEFPSGMNIGGAFSLTVQPGYLR